MMRETAMETWFGNIFKSSRKSISWQSVGPELGILAFEVSRLMSNVVNLWHCLDDKQIVRLREEVANSVGIQKLISEDNDYLMDLVLAEIIDTFGSVSKSVSMLGKKCVDPKYHSLENVFDNITEIDPKWYGWRYRLKKMERKVKKMDKFVATTEQLYQEFEVLVELEQSLKRMRAGADIGRNRQVKLLEFQKKVIWQRQEVKNLREMSPWIRSYDYIVRLLLRSLFTITERIKYVYGNNQTENSKGNNGYHNMHSDRLICSNSIAPSESDRYEIQIERSFSNLSVGDVKSKSKNKSFLHYSPSTILCGKQNQMKTSRFIAVGFTKSCMSSGSYYPVIERYTPSRGSSFRSNGPHKDLNEIKITSPVIYSKTHLTKVKSFFNSKLALLNAPYTLGYAGLALHYANVIILIEKLASSPHLISLDARDDLYNILPATIRSCLRAKLKTFSRKPASSVYDAELAPQWSLAITRILDWLSPLAHNMIRWQSERNFERQRLVFGSHVLLVQTLHFANKVETEAAIVELLMGLNYLFRLGQEINENRFRESSYDRAYDVFPPITRVTT